MFLRNGPRQLVKSEQRCATSRVSIRYPATLKAVGGQSRPVSISAVQQTTRRGVDKASLQSLPSIRTHTELELLTWDPSSLSLWRDSDNSSRLPNYFLVSLKDPPPKNQGKSPDYYANVGDAIRNLREDIPVLFQKDLNYNIYRDDIVFKDPRNSFQGLKNYKLIFWSLRFHGRLFFSHLYVDVKRIWQPEDTTIKMRWTVRGIPRVPWEAEGVFEGVSEYKLDQSGKIYEHSVDNVIMRDPPVVSVSPLLASLNLLPTPQQQPCPGAWFRDVQPNKPNLAEQRRQDVELTWRQLYLGFLTTLHLVALTC